MSEKLYPQIPKTPPGTFFRERPPRESPVPRVGAPIVVASWTCWPELHYCSGGERGVRCTKPDCADRGQYHDPGDEDPRSP